MPAERNAFKLGITLILFFVLLIAVLVFLAPTGEGDMVLHVRYPHNEFTTELKSGGKVTCAGKTVGAITEFNLVEYDDEETGARRLYAVVTIAVAAGLNLRDDCRIVPEGLLLGGVGKLSILDRGQGEPLASGTTIEGEIGADIAGLTRMLRVQLDPKDPASLMSMVKAMLDAGDPGSLMGKILISLEDINAMTTQLRDEFDDPTQREDLLGQLHAILDNVNQATSLLRDELDHQKGQAMVSKIHETLDTLNAGLNTAVAILEENREPIGETVGHVRDTARILEQDIAARIADQLDPAREASLIAKVHVAIDRLGRSLDDINTITGAGRETIVLNKGQINAMIANFKETSDHLKGATKDLRRSPWRLFYQPRIEEAAQANVFDAARAFSEAATKLDDTVSRIEALSESGSATVPADDPQLAEIREQLEQTFSYFRKAEDALWEELKIK